MRGDVVTAARWLGASMILASLILVGGLRWARSGEPGPPGGAILSSSGQAGTLDPNSRGPAGSSRVEVCGDASPSGIRILDPIPGEFARAGCLDPPGEDEIWAKVAGSGTGPTVTDEAWRENARILVEKIGEKVDPCKVFPLAGPCQLVHCHYKCSVYFDESYRSDYPIPFNHRKARVEVVFIDKDHLRRCGGPSATAPRP